MKKLLSFIFKNLDSLILSIGGLLIVIRVFYPPKYYLIRGIRFPYEGTRGFAPISDFETAILHSIGIAVITGVLFFLSKKIKKLDIYNNNIATSNFKEKVDNHVRFIINPQFVSASNFSEGLASVAIRKTVSPKYGFINKLGEVIVPFKFDDALNFSEGLAPVELKGKWGFIDKQGNLIIKPQFHGRISGFHEGIAFVSMGDMCVLINTKGDIIVRFPYDDDVIRRYPLHSSEGLVTVKIQDKWSYIDNTGNFITTALYDDASDFSEGFAAVELNNKWGFINRAGEMIINPSFDTVYSFYKGLAAVEVNGEWGFINQMGEMIINPAFDSVCGYSEGFAAVEINGKWGFINHNGDIAIKPIFDSVDRDHGFFEGLTAVNVSGKWGFIDKQGNLIIKPQFDSAYSYPIRTFSEGLAAVKINGKWGYINKKGELIIKPRFDGESILSPYIDAKGKLKLKTYQDYAYSFSNGLAKVKVNNKFGYIDKSGNYVFKPIFKSADVFHEGLAAVQLKGKWGFIGVT